MARSKPPRKTHSSQTRLRGLTRSQRGARNRVLKSLADIVRSLGLIFVGGPLIEPFVNPGESFSQTAATAAVIAGLGLLATSLILTAVRSDDP